RPVERLSEVVAFGRVAAQIASEHPSNEEAQALACRLGAKFFVQGSVAYAGPTVTLQATLYEGGRARRSAKAEGRVGAEESEVMDRVWAGLYPEFTPGADATLPNGGPEALAAYLNAEAAFRRATIAPRATSTTVSFVRAPDSPLPAHRLDLGRRGGGRDRRHAHPRLGARPARAAPHGVPAQLARAAVSRVPGGGVRNAGAADRTRTGGAAVSRAARRHRRGAGPHPPHGRRRRSCRGLGRQRPPATRARVGRLSRTGAGPMDPAGTRDRAARVGRLAERCGARARAPRRSRRHR